MEEQHILWLLSCQTNHMTTLHIAKLAVDFPVHTFSPYSPLHRRPFIVNFRQIIQTQRIHGKQIKHLQSFEKVFWAHRKKKK